MKKSDVVLLGVGALGFGVAAFLLVNHKPVATVAQSKDEATNDYAKQYPPSLDLSFLTGSFDMLTKTIGIRNNNPLNIRFNSENNWNGQTGQDRYGFCVFDTPENGIRAGAKTLDSYARIGVNTIEKIISKWAPSSENNVPAYVAAVEKDTGIDRKAVINKSRDYLRLIAAMIKHENGSQPYSMATIQNGINLS